MYVGVHWELDYWGHIQSYCKESVHVIVGAGQVSLQFTGQQQEGQEPQPPPTGGFSLLRTPRFCSRALLMGVPTVEGNHLSSCLNADVDLTYKDSSAYRDRGL